MNRGYSGRFARLTAVPRTMGWALLDQMVVSGANFATGVLLARHLGIEMFGQYSLYWLLILFVLALQIALVGAPMMVITPKVDPDRVRSYYGATLVLQAVLSTAVFGLTILVFVVANQIIVIDQPVSLALSVAVASLTIPLHEYYRRIFLAMQRRKAALMLDVARYGLQVAVLLAIVIIAEEPVAIPDIVWMLAGCGLVAAAGAAACMPRPSLQATLFRTFVRRHWRFGKWLGVSALLQLASVGIVYLVAGWLVGTAAVGAMRACETIMNVLNVLFRGAENALIPVLSKYIGDKNLTGFRDALVEATKIGAVVTVVVVLFVGVFSDQIMDLVFGDEYAAYHYLILLYCVIYLVRFFAVPTGGGLHALEQTRPFLHVAVIQVSIAAVAVFPLVLLAETYGAAATLLIADVALHAGLVVYFVRAYRQLARARLSS